MKISSYSVLQNTSSHIILEDECNGFSEKVNKSAHKLEILREIISYVQRSNNADIAQREAARITDKAKLLPRRHGKLTS
jgi:uncharacterized protein YaaW (UPF0174 family)